MNNPIIAGGMYFREDILSSFFPYAVITFLIMLSPILIYQFNKQVFQKSVAAFTCGYLLYLLISSMLGSACPHYDVLSQMFLGSIGSIITLIFYTSKTSVTEWKTILFLIIINCFIFLFGSRVPVDLYKIATDTYLP